jgi:hypothetical protein
MDLTFIPLILMAALLALIALGLFGGRRMRNPPGGEK